MITRTYIVSRTKKLLDSRSHGFIRFMAVSGLLLYPMLILMWFSMGGVLLLAGIVALSLILIVVGSTLLAMAMKALIQAFKSSCLSISMARELQRDEAPLLFETVEEICKTLKCTVPRRIEIDEKENACVYAEPSRFFGMKPVLRIGLPILMAMRPEEFRAVLAHECGHLLRNDHIFGRILHRIEMGWIAANDGAAENEHLPFILRYIKKWLEPLLKPYLYADGRLSEEHADRVSSELYPDSGTAKARLGMFLLYGNKITMEWSIRQMKDFEVPPHLMTRRRLEKIRELWNKDEAADCLQGLMCLPDNLLYAHPTYLRVLEIAGVHPDNVSTDPPPEIIDSAAPLFLGKSFESIEAELDLERRTLSEESWKKYHVDYQHAERTLRLEEPLPSQTDALLSRAYCHATLGQRALALIYFERVATERPDDPNPSLSLAEMLLETDDSRAPEVVESLIKKFPAQAFYLLESLLQYHARNKDIAKAQSALSRLFEMNDRWDAAIPERMVLNDKSIIEPHKIEEKKKIHLKSLLLQMGDVAEVRLAQKKLTDFVEAPIFLILIRYSGAPRGSAKLRIQRNQQIAQQIPPQLGEYFVYDSKSGKRLWKKTAKMPDATLFRRN
jgi:Zn-dependent protease with chaperone function